MVIFRDDNDDDEYYGLYQWKLGDPVDDCNGGTLDAQNWGYEYFDDEVKGTYTDPRIEGYGKKAWNLYMDYKEEEALHYINLALDLDDKYARNWNRKAIILEALKRYEESEECYNKSLELSSNNRVYDNKARMLYDWASSLLELKQEPNSLKILEEAQEKIIKAINARPGEKSEEDLKKFLRLRDSIEFYIEYEKRFLINLERLKKYDKSELFTITGINHCNSKINPYPEMPLKLKKEPDNQFYSDAIAVYAYGEKFGYVANSDYTKYELTSSASELKDKIPDVADGEFLLFMDRYADINFIIGRIVK